MQLYENSSKMNKLLRIWEKIEDIAKVKRKMIEIENHISETDIVTKKKIGSES